MSALRALADALSADTFSGLSDAAAVPLLRAATVTVEGPIPARGVKKLWGQRMVLAAALLAAENADLATPLRILCRATYDNLMGDLFADLDPSDPTQGPTVTAYLDGLEQAGVLSADVRAETLALSRTEVPLLERIGWGILREMDDASAEAAVAAARKVGA